MPPSTRAPVLQGPATIILDSDEGCPPRPVPKTKPSAEDKAAYKAKLAAKAEAQKVRRDKLADEGAAGAGGNKGRPVPVEGRGGVEGGAEGAGGGGRVAAADAADAERGAKLAERFKEAMTESY